MPLRLEGEVKARLFEYDDFRRFLHDYFQEQKKLRRVFTHRFFARKGGFKNPSYAHYLIKGRYKVTPTNLKKLIKALELDSRAAEYFETLVEFNQANSFEERSENARNLEALRKKASFYRLHRDQYEFFSSWHMPVLRVIAGYGEWHGDFKRLGALVFPPISAERAKDSVETLVRIGMLAPHEVRNSEGTKVTHYRPTSEAITTENVPPTAMAAYRREMLQRVMDTADTLSADERYIAYSTLGTSKETYTRICNYLKEVRKNIVQMALADKHIERVYQLNLNLVPLSRPFAMRENLPEYKMPQASVDGQEVEE